MMHIGKLLAGVGALAGSSHALSIDYISPVVGYRVWTLGAAGLKSLCGERWRPGESLAARCRACTIVGRPGPTHDHDAPRVDCTCGIYSAKKLGHLCGGGYEQYAVHGEVYLWGKVVEHEQGWRAQFAYPKKLVLSPDVVSLTLQEIQPRLRALVSYGSDIFIRGNRKTISLWGKDSGFDAAGLDYLVKIGKESYVRPQPNPNQSGHPHLHYQGPLSG